jgi:transposase
VIRTIQAGEVPGLPQNAAAALKSLATQLDTLAGEICKLDRQLMAWHRANETRQRLETIPGVASSPPQHWLPACPTPLSSSPATSSRPSLAWIRARIHPTAKTV